MSRFDMLQLSLFLEPDFEEELQRARWAFDALCTSGLVLWRGRPLVVHDDEREACFWHLVTSGEVVRRLDRVRTAGVMRMWSLLECVSYGEPGVRWWVEQRRGQAFHVAPDDFTFLVVLQSRGDGFTVVTAFPCPRHAENLAARHIAADENDLLGLRSARAPRSARELPHPMWRRVDGVCRMPAQPIPAKVRTRGGGLPSSFVEDHYATAVQAVARRAREARRVARGRE